MGDLPTSGQAARDSRNDHAFSLLALKAAWVYLWQDWEPPSSPVLFLCLGSCTHPDLTQ